MTPREIVLEQIYHRETETVPYTLSFEGDLIDFDLVTLVLGIHAQGRRQNLNLFFTTCFTNGNALVAPQDQHIFAIFEVLDDFLNRFSVCYYHKS